MNRLVSVILPVFNAEKYLHNCVDSILAQTFTDYELLLINDGSTDKSGVICDEYALKDNRIRVFHKENGGVSSARNLGLEYATGEWISFVDSDDWLVSDFYKTIFNSSSLADIIYVSNVEHLEDGTIVIYQAREFYSKNKKDIEKTFLYLKNNSANYPFYGFTWNKLFRNSIIKKNKIRFIDKFSLYEDELFTNEYCKYIHDIKVLSQPIYHYRRNSEGLTNQVRKIDDLLLLVEQIYGNSKCYSLEDLIIYEQKRALSFLRQALSLDTKQKRLKEILYILKMLEKSLKIDIGKKLRLLSVLGLYNSKVLFRIYKYIFGTSFF